MGFLRDILNRPEHEHAMLVMPVGYPDEGAKVPNLQRKNMEDVSYFV
jgi:nitroreductase